MWLSVIIDIEITLQPIMEQLLVFLLLLAAILVQIKAVDIYIKSANGNVTDIDHLTLQDYINGTRQHTIYGRNYNNTRLLLLPGKHFLHTDFIIQNAHDFTVHGNNSKIYCNNSFLGIAFMNVMDITLNDIEIINCGKSYILQSDSEEGTNSSGAVYFNQCTNVNVSGISLTAQSGTNGIITINTSQRNKLSVFQDIMVTTNCTITSLSSSGMLIYYHDHYSKAAASNPFESQLSNYKYKTIGVCKRSVALNIATNQSTFDVSINIFDTNFNYLNKSGVLKYHAESCGRSIINFQNCTIEQNQGNKYLKLFLIIFSNHGDNISSTGNNIDICNKQKNIIKFTNSAFVKNAKMMSILYIILLHSANVIIDIRDCIFEQNYNTQIIKTTNKVNILWQLTHHIILTNTKMISNRHNKSGCSLISSANSLVKFLQSVIIKNNVYDQSIVRLRFSVLRLQGYSEFSGNHAHFILYSTGASYYIMEEYSCLNITKNYVYSVMRIATVYNEESEAICFLQFISNQSDIEKHIRKNSSLNYHVDLINNVYAAPKFRVQELILYYKDCTWLKDTAFSSINSSVVYGKVIRKTIKYDKEVGLLTICPCFNFSIYNCNQRHIGTVSPGQSLSIKLRLKTVQKFQKTFVYSFARTENMPKACHLLNVFELEQEHQSNQCIEHNYTIWSQLSECELYLRADVDEEITETLYIRLTACPAGFVLCRKKGACYCDPTLYPYVTSCNLNDETVLRPANSWVFAYTVNQKYEYKISRLCPYDYCLSHASHINLSMPDTQCQFHRTGLLCGQCQQGLSNTFGSSQCKRCSNYYLFIIIPIAVAGAVLVMMIFIFNLTVTSGTINTFIFYVNIISINYSLFFPKCNSIDCLLLSLSNLDLGFEMCFYNGMDGYSKALLQLAFPFYLIVIAFALIIGSRHSAKIQRITSQRALHVLATLFLLSYTKFLLTVCQVLFFYSEIIHLPSKHITLVWSLDVSVPLFGVKFLVAFIICLVIFIILLHFNFLLLFSRKLLRFKYINTFKPLLDAYFGPYKDNFFYWTGLQLILRAIFLGLSAFHQNVNLTCGIVALGILLCLQGLLHPFKSNYKNVQEALVILNLLAVYALALYSDGDNDTGVQIIQALIILVLVYFFTVAFYHCLISTSACSKIILKMKNRMAIHLEALKDKMFTSSGTFGAINLNDVGSSRVSGNYHEFQESLIVLDN